MRRGRESWIILQPGENFPGRYYQCVEIPDRRMQSRGRFFTWWPVKEQEAMGINWDIGHSSIPLQQKCFLMFKWNRLLGEVVESLFLEILKTWQGTVLNNMLCSALLWAGSYARSPEGASNFDSVIPWHSWICKCGPLPSLLLCSME